MIVDLALVRRVEHAAAQHCILQASVLDGARAVEIDDGALIGMGSGRYVNRAFGIGLRDTSAAALVLAVDSFYAELGVPPTVELCPWVREEVMAEFATRGYGAVSFTSVLARELADLPARTGVTIELVDTTTEEAWTAVHGARFAAGSTARATSDEYCAAMRSLPRSQDLVVLDDGVAVAAASFTMVGDIAWFGGAGTVEARRGSGFQSALIAERLHRAVDAGGRLAVATAVPSGPSARNLLRAGFQLLYVRTVLSRG